MNGELEEVVDQLRTIEERLRDLAYDRLRLAAEEGDPDAVADEKQILTARRAVEQAIRALGALRTTDLGSGVCRVHTCGMRPLSRSISSRRRGQPWRSNRNATRSSSTWSSSAISAGVASIRSIAPRTMMSANSSLSAASSSASGAWWHAQHEATVDEAQRVVVREEAEELVDGDVDVVGDRDEAEVVLARCTRGPAARAGRSRASVDQ